MIHQVKMVKEKSKREKEKETKSVEKKVSKPMTAKELGPTKFTSQKDYEEQVKLEEEAE